MLTLQKLRIVSVFLVIISACAPSVDSATRTLRLNTTENASVKNTPTAAASKLNIEAETLRGVQVKVWHPWFGAEASLFESQIAEFNSENQWGIIISGESKNNYSELFLETDEALK